MYEFAMAFIPTLLFYRFIRYITTPLLRKVGYYMYHSPLFFTQPLFLNVQEIHLGTTWDFFKLPSVGPKIIFGYVAEGLLNLAEAIEQGRIDPETRFRGYTFYLKKTTIKRFGFKTRKLNVIEAILFSLSYFEVCLLKSISCKKLSIVPIGNVHIVFCTAQDIVKMKPLYRQIHDQLRIHNQTNPVGKQHSDDPQLLEAT